MSITSRIASMEEHISEAYDELQGLGADLTDVNKNIENISSVLDTIYDSMPQVSGEGTSITLDNTRVGKIKSTLKGNTSQNGTPTPSSPIPVNVVSGDNSIVVTGKNLLDQDYYKNATYSTNVYRYTQLNIRGGRKLYFKAQLKEGKSNITGLYFCLSDKGNPNTSGSTFCWSVYNGTIVDNSSPYNKNYATFPNDDSLYISFYPTTVSVSDIFETYNLLVSENDIDYEPYTGATNPINLPVENLLSSSMESGSYDVSTGEKTANQSIVRNATPISVKPNTTYILSYDKNPITTGVLYYDNNNNYLTYQAITNTYFTTPNNCYNLNFYYYIGSTTIDMEKFQLELGTKVNSYTPYGTTPIELCNIPNTDYEDTFIHDKTLDKWYLHKEIGKVVLNGSEDWNGGNKRGDWYSFFWRTEIIKNNVDNELLTISNYFQGYANPNSVIEGAVTGITTRPSSSGQGFYIRSNLTTSLASDFKNWLSSHNTIVYYVLANSTNTEITYQLLIEQLNNFEKAMSYNGQTNISQVNNDLPFIISASALKEWQESNVSTLSMVNPLSLGNTLNTQENDIQPIEVDNIEPLEEGNYEES